MKKSELKQIIREEIKNAKESGFISLHTLVNKILKSKTPEIQNMLGGEEKVDQASQSPKGMIPKALYHVGSFGLYASKVRLSNSGKTAVQIHFNYPTRLYNKATHQEIKEEIENSLIDEGLWVKEQTDSVGTSNSVTEWLVVDTQDRYS